VRASAADAIAAIYSAAPLRSWIPIALDAASAEAAQTRAFVPASVAVARTVVRTHRAVVRALAAEVAQGTMLRLLKCAVALAKATPYATLARFALPTLATSLLDAVVARISASRCGADGAADGGATEAAEDAVHYEAVASVAALLRVEALAAHVAPRLDPALGATDSLLLRLLEHATALVSAPPRVAATKTKMAVTSQRCVVALGAIAAAATLHPQCVISAWPALHALLLRALSSRDEAQRAAAVALLDAWIQGGEKSSLGCKVGAEVGAEVCTKVGSALSAMVALDGFCAVVGEHVLTRGLADPSAKVRAAVCQCAQGVPSTIWRALSPAVRSACARGVTKALGDKDKRVRPAACGALAFWSKLSLPVAVDPPSARGADGAPAGAAAAADATADAPLAPPPNAMRTLVQAMANDTNLVVRTRAAWALASWVERLGEFLYVPLHLTRILLTI
jgi:hypothetical protein